MSVTTAQVASATPLELVIISYGEISENLENAMLYANTDYIKFKNHLDNAKKFLHELIISLDLSYDIAGQLMNIYTYINKLITRYQISKQDSIAKEINKLINILLDAWKSIEDDDKQKVMSNIDYVYSGLTYGKNGLNECVIGNENKGIKV